MNHTDLAKLILYLGDRPDQLRTGELEEYIWLVEQLLQELRQSQVWGRAAAAQENPVRP